MADTNGWRNVLAERGEDLLKHWLEAASAPLRGRVSAQELQRDGRELFAALARAAGTGDDADLRALLVDLSRTRARQGLTPSETAVSVFAVKDAYVAVAGTDDVVGLLELSRYVDDLGLVTFETYVATRERVITEQAEQLMELSTPVVKLWDGIVAVPLVGTLDSARTQVVMENLLQTLVDTGSEHAIIDITGVPAVDTQVAQHLLKTVVAARLMGAECVISGIRPQIAATIVSLGIEFGDIATKSSLADALALALRRSGVRLQPAGRQER